MKPNHRKGGKQPIHPWPKIAEWAGWRKGKVAAKTDGEVAEMWGVNRHWVSDQRARRGVLRLHKDKRSWSEEDYRLIVETCKAIGRSPGAFVGEHQRRVKGGRG